LSEASPVNVQEFFVEYLPDCARFVFRRQIFGKGINIV
jgi:hypothetical protein